jgi:hypothetical protein
MSLQQEPQTFKMIGVARHITVISSGQGRRMVEISPLALLGRNDRK